MFKNRQSYYFSYVQITEAIPNLSVLRIQIKSTLINMFEDVEIFPTEFSSLTIDNLDIAPIAFSKKDTSYISDKSDMGLNDLSVVPVTYQKINIPKVLDTNKLLITDIFIDGRKYDDGGNLIVDD